MTKKISMLTLKPLKLRGRPVGKDERIEVENRKVATLLTATKLAREVPDFDYAFGFAEPALKPVVIGMDLADKSDDVTVYVQPKPAKRAYKRRGPKVRK